MSYTVSVHIEELVLIGIRPGDRDRVAQALQSELTRLLRQRPLPSGTVHGELAVDRVVAPRQKLAAGDRRSVGQLAAAQVHSVLRSAW